jgi:tetratricopeptide (TPR) repeat protein
VLYTARCDRFRFARAAILGDNVGSMSVSLRRLPLLIATLSLLASAPAAWGQAKPDPKTAAKEHYARGTSFYDLGKYEEAIKEFEAAYHLKNDPAFLYNLAQSYRLAGNAERALHFYRTYLRYVPKAPKRAEIEDRIQALEQQLATAPKTTTTPPPVGTTPPPVGTTPPPVGTTPPPVGTTPPPGGTTPPPPDTTGPTVTVTPPPPTTLPPPPGDTSTPPPPITTTPSGAVDPGRKFRIAGIATGSAGGALILIGIIQTARASAAAKDIEDLALMGKPFDPEIERRGQSAENAQWLCYGIGVLAGATGAALWYYGKRVSAAAETTTWQVSLAPVVAPTGSGATLRITF